MNELYNRVAIALVHSACVNMSTQVILYGYAGNMDDQQSSPRIKDLYQVKVPGEP